MSTAKFTQSLTGTWILFEFKSTDPKTGISTYPMGPDARGHLIYSNDGHVSAQIMRSKPLNEPDKKDPANDSLVEAMRHYFCYAGPYEVTESEGKVILKHSVQVCSYPHWLGGIQERVAELNGDYLTLKSHGDLQSKVQDESKPVTLLWRRAL